MRPGIAVLNRRENEREDKTIVVLGCGRGGTSAAYGNVELLTDGEVTSSSDSPINFQ
jgi:hypothetical protein